jgi:hypothetical protein
MTVLTTTPAAATATIIVVVSIFIAVFPVPVLRYIIIHVLVIVVVVVVVVVVVIAALRQALKVIVVLPADNGWGHHRQCLAPFCHDLERRCLPSPSVATCLV